MRIRMLHRISGTRNGVAWPAPGDELELPSEEAVALLQSRMAEAVKAPVEPEKAAMPAAETPVAPKKAPQARKPAQRKTTRKTPAKKEG